MKFQLYNSACARLTPVNGFSGNIKMYISVWPSLLRGIIISRWNSRILLQPPPIYTPRVRVFTRVRHSRKHENDIWGNFNCRLFFFGHTARHAPFGLLGGPLPSIYASLKSRPPRKKDKHQFLAPLWDYMYYSHREREREYSFLRVCVYVCVLWRLGEV